MPSWAAVGVGAAGAVSSAKKASGATGGASDAAEYAAFLADKLNRERYSEAQGYLQPYIDESRQGSEQLMVEMGLAPGEAGTAYMETPGYQMAIDERSRAVNTGAAGAGMLYSGRRGLELAKGGSDVHNQYYTNYMNTLQNIANPQAAQNLSALGMNQGLAMGQQNIAAQNTSSNYKLQGVQAENAATADLVGGLTNVFSGYMQGQTPTQ